jgi:hypothetical protein
MSLHANDLLVAATTWRNHVFCAWCRRDLGLLPYSSTQPSYGICATCQHAYFADYYQEDRAVLKQRTVGAEAPDHPRTIGSPTQQHYQGSLSATEQSKNDMIRGSLAVEARLGAAAEIALAALA